LGSLRERKKKRCRGVPKILSPRFMRVGCAAEKDFQSFFLFSFSSSPSPPPSRVHAPTERHCLRSVPPSAPSLPRRPGKAVSSPTALSRSLPASLVPSVHVPSSMNKEVTCSCTCIGNARRCRIHTHKAASVHTALRLLRPVGGICAQTL
jgi:hypothetical protein